MNSKVFGLTIGLALGSPGNAWGEDLYIGRSYSGTIAVCDNMKLAREIVKTDQQQGREAATILFNLAQRNKQCGLLQDTFKLLKIVYSAKMPDGRVVVVVEIYHGVPEDVFGITSNSVMNGVPI